MDEVIKAENERWRMAAMNTKLYCLIHNAIVLIVMATLIITLYCLDAGAHAAWPGLMVCFILAPNSE